MKTTDENRMAAPCGTYCEICFAHQAEANQALVDSLVARGIPRDRFPCPGCREVQGACPVLEAPCSTYGCAVEKGVDFCHECSEFPCDRLNPAAHRAETLPHNLKIFHLCFLKQHGLEAWKAKAADIQRRYYKGIMRVGEGPVVS